MDTRDKRAENTNMVDGDLALHNNTESSAPVHAFTRTSDGKTWIDRKRMLKQRLPD